MTLLNPTLKRKLENQCNFKTGDIVKGDQREFSEGFATYRFTFFHLPRNQTTKMKTKSQSRSVFELKSCFEIAYFMDIVGYLFVWKDGQRKMITASNEKLLTKDRTNLISNESPIDFSVWVDLAKWIKIKESQETIGRIDKIRKKRKATSTASEKRSASQKHWRQDREKLFAVRNEMRTLRMRKTPQNFERMVKTIRKRIQNQSENRHFCASTTSIQQRNWLKNKPAILSKEPEQKIGELVCNARTWSKSSPAEERRHERTSTKRSASS